MVTKGILHCVMPARTLKTSWKEERTRGWDQELLISHSASRRTGVTKKISLTRLRFPRGIGLGYRWTLTRLLCSVSSVWYRAGLEDNCEWSAGQILLMETWFWFEGSEYVKHEELWLRLFLFEWVKSSEISLSLQCICYIITASSQFTWNFGKTYRSLGCSGGSQYPRAAGLNLFGTRDRLHGR